MKVILCNKEILLHIQIYVIISMKKYMNHPHGICIYNHGVCVHTCTCNSQMGHLCRDGKPVIVSLGSATS